MAKIEMLYPLSSATGNFSTGRFRTDITGIHLIPRPDRPATKHSLSVAPKTLPCLAWKLADQLWQQFEQETKDEWRRAIKAGNISCYDLWMKECLTNWNAGKWAPRTPSISGGFSLKKTNQDSLLPPPNSDYNIKLLNDMVRTGRDPFRFVGDPIDLSATKWDPTTVRFIWTPPPAVPRWKVGYYSRVLWDGPPVLHKSIFWNSLTGSLFTSALLPGRLYEFDFFFWEAPAFSSTFLARRVQL